MSIPRQEGSFGREGSAESGRVNQKRRTRAAIVAAAQELLSAGTTPTVAEAAEAALVSRTTAYRYFPTQESLLVELSMTLDVGDVEDLVARPLADGETVAERLLDVLDRFNRNVADSEVEYRTALRLYQDQWLATSSAGESPPLVREGRRTRWFRTLLESGASAVSASERDRLVAALSMLTGAEALVVLRDVCQLDDDEGRSVVNWAARTLIEATLGAPAD